MNRMTPFTDRDRELGSVLRELLGPGGDTAAFVARVLARAREGQQVGAWWDVLGGWARPGLAAAALLAVTALFGGRSLRTEATAVTIDDALVQLVDTTDQGALILSPDPPDADVVMLAASER